MDNTNVIFTKTLSFCWQTLSYLAKLAFMLGLASLFYVIRN